MRWLNEPPAWSEHGSELRLTTAPDTDFWRTTHYGFVRDSGHFRYRGVAGDFAARVQIEGAYRDQYDQAGLMVRLDQATWMKCGIEYVDGRQWASAVITRELSDWSVVELEPAPARLWFEVRRTGEAVQVSYGENAPGRLLRLGALTRDRELGVGVMAASPEGRGFEVVLSDFAVILNQDVDKPTG
jgi:regulation of enolase protein 1 (concanavalin A-like superfamily)